MVHQQHVECWPGYSAPRFRCSGCTRFPVPREPQCALERPLTLGPPRGVPSLPALLAPQRAPVSLYTPGWRRPLLSGRVGLHDVASHFLPVNRATSPLSLRRVYVVVLSDAQSTRRSHGPLSVISSRLDENRRGTAIYGRNCYLACQELGVKPPMRYLDDDTDVVDFVLSANMSRQNLDTGQRAMVMAAKDKLRWGE